MQYSQLKIKINSLKPSGLTAGGKGIKLGYKTAAKNKLANGKNLVVVITDGAFNTATDEDYMKCVKKYSKQNIEIAIVGIKPSDRDAQKMTETAKLGNGNYVEIDSILSAEKKLTQLVRLICKK